MGVEDAEAEDRSQVGALSLQSLAVDVEDRTGSVALGLGIDGENKNTKEKELAATGSSRMLQRRTSFYNGLWFSQTYNVAW